MRTSCLNRVELAGHAGRVAEKETADGRTVRFTVRTEFAYRKGGTRIILETTYTDVALTVRKDADVPFREGDAVYVIGHLVNRPIVDSDGNERYVTEVVASRVGKIETKKNLTFEE